MRITFCGVGALGSTAAWFCRNLDATLHFVDFDRVESKNLLSQVFVKQSLGKNKAEALKLILRNFFGVQALAHGVRLTEHNAQELLGEAELLVDCFDNHQSRVLVSRFATRANRPLLHAGLAGEGNYGIVRWDSEFNPDAEDSEGQATCEGGAYLPLIALVAATVARSLQDYVVHARQVSYSVSLNGVRET